jgi:hypothetical protein
LTGSAEKREAVTVVVVAADAITVTAPVRLTPT